MIINWNTNLISLGLIAGINEELNEYFGLLKNINNPVYISILITVLVFVFLYLTVKYIIIPLKRQHAVKENELKLQNIRLMALFADLDPDPLLRLNKEGKVIFINPAARERGLEQLLGKELKSIFPKFDLDVEIHIKDNKSSSFFQAYLNRYFVLQVNGISNLNIAQIYFHDITELTINQRALEKSQIELKEFSKKLQLRVEEERQRISTELHDDIGQNLLLLRLNLQRTFSDITGETNSPFYRDITLILDQTVKDLKGISYSLKPMVLKELGLVPALSNLVNKISKESGIDGHFGNIDMERRFDPNFETAIYRIVQEALNNIVKYSKAKEFNIELINKGTRINLIISDDGVGFDQTNIEGKNGMGITNMKERTEAFDGTFRLNSSPEDGTIIIADFPLEVKS